MAALTSWKWTTASGSLIDLTSIAVNPSAAATITPRQGGFVARNRFNASNLSAANKNLWTAANLPAGSNVEAVNRMKVLEIPERVRVNDFSVYAVDNQTAPNFTFTPVAAVGASDLVGTSFFAGAYWNKKETSNASYAAASDLVQVTAANSLADDGTGVVAGAVFGQIAVTKATLVPTWVLQDVDSSIAGSTKPMNTAWKFRQTGSALEEPMGHYFPHGGYVYMALGPYNASLASSAGVADNADYYASSVGATIDLAGVWEIQANCNYVPA
jgi:hypothetical protein